jgi:hypothetical protein
MRHFPPIALLSSSMRKPPVSACLVLTTGFPHGFGSSHLAATKRAVLIATVTPRADEEHLPAFPPFTHDISKRVHVPGPR